MESIGDVSSKIAEWAKRCAERAESPEFKANAERLARENADAVEVARESGRKHRLLASGVPYSVWETIRAPESTPALEAVRSFLASSPSCVFLALAGPAGRGKTFAAAWAIAEHGGRYAVAHDLVTAGTFDPVWRELAEVPIVALDELGAEYRNAAFEASLYTLLNARHAHQRKTILSTNLSAAAFADRYCPKPDDPLRDRLRTASQWVNLPGESLRKPWSDTDKDEEGTP